MSGLSQHPDAIGLSDMTGIYDLPTSAGVMDAWRTDPKALSGSRLLRAWACVERTARVTLLRVGGDDATIMRQADRDLRYHALSREVDARLGPSVIVNMSSPALTRVERT